MRCGTGGRPDRIKHRHVIVIVNVLAATSHDLLSSIRRRRRLRLVLGSAGTAAVAHHILRRLGIAAPHAARCVLRCLPVCCKVLLALHRRTLTVSLPRDAVVPMHALHQTTTLCDPPPAHTARSPWPTNATRRPRGPQLRP